MTDAINVRYERNPSFEICHLLLPKLFLFYKIHLNYAQMYIVPLGYVIGILIYLFWIISLRDVETQ